MRIHGLQKLTLLDYPGHTACTVFTAACNFRCPFCQNAALVLRPNAQPEIGEEEFFRFLEGRRGLLEGVCITGGEPTLHWDLPAFALRVRESGFDVKLDTNGTDPKMLESLMAAGVVNYVAMDIKSSPERYGVLAGREDLDLGPIRESAALLLEGRIPCEFRTTVVKELHRREDFEAIGAWLRGAEAYFLQGFVDSGDLISPGLSACTREEMESFRQAALPFIPNTQLRGVD